MRLEVYNFRNCRWGMSKQQVKKNEKEKLNRLQPLKDALFYDSQLEGFKVLIMYQFKNYKLYVGVYKFYIDPKDYYSHFKVYFKLKNLLEKVYGKASRDSSVELDNIDITTYAENIGKKIEQGQYNLTAQWFLENTVIGLELSSKDSKLLLQNTYVNC